MSFFGVPLSGLVASQDQLQAISNNLANLDTVGYKDENTSFSDIFAQGSATNGADNPLQIGLGTQVAATTSNFTNGSPTSTGIPSNMALQGNGFFVTQSAGGTTAYTRAGDFTTNSSGYLVTSSGDYVLGYQATNGVVSTSSALQPLQVGTGSVSPAVATTSFSLPTNLDANDAVGSTFNSPISVYDSLGNPHQLSVAFTKTSANNWSYSVNMPTSDTGASSSVVASGTLTFDSTGKLTSPSGSITGITVPSFTDGAAAMNLTWNLNDSSGNPTLTQTAVADATTDATQNGSATGTVTGYSVASDGTIEGTYSNGTTRALGQVAIAAFTDTQGLQRTGDNQYEQTAGSGAPQVGIAGTGGRGTIIGGSVEESNVDTATEFAKMIVAQQAYQANAKTVTTLDQISQATLAMLAT